LQPFPGLDTVYKASIVLPRTLARKTLARATVTDGEIRLWRWRFTDEFGKRRVYPCRLTEEDAKQRLRDAERVEGSLETRQPTGSTGDFLRAKRRPLATQRRRRAHIGTSHGISTHCSRSLWIKSKTRV